MSKIEWTDETWNPIVGCSLVSPGCMNCYAMTQANRIRRLQNDPPSSPYFGTTKIVSGNLVWTGKVALAPDRTLLKPLRRRKPTVYFVNSMGDLFHEDVPDAWIDRVFAVMALAPQHTFIVLTKRAKRMRWYVAGEWTGFRIRNAMQAIKPQQIIEMDWPLPNLVLGVSGERQQEADERIPDLLATPAAKRIVSAEPLLGPIDFGPLVREAVFSGKIAGVGGDGTKPIAGIIVGGESGPAARPMHPDWPRAIRDQCEAAGVPFFFKQWGEYAVELDRERDDPDWRRDYQFKLADEGATRWLNVAGGRGFHGDRFHVMRRVGKKRAGRQLDGREHNDLPWSLAK